MYNYLKSKPIQSYHEKHLPSTHLHQQNPAAKRTPNLHPSGTANGGLTQLTLMTESPIPQQTHKPNPAPANPNPNTHHPTQNPNVGKTIQGKCHALEKTQTSKQLLIKNLDKMLELRDRKVVPKAFQINIKLTFPGTNPTREQIETWWAAEKEAGLTLLSAAIKTNRELALRMDQNSSRINAEISQELKNPALSNMDRELWTLFVQKAREGLETTATQNVMEREKKKTPSSTPKNSPRPQAPKKGGKGKGKKQKKH